MISQKPIFQIRAEVADVLVVGRTPYGERRMVGILGGSVQGEKLNGRILPGGSDWQIVRSDHAVDIKAQYIIETTEGARVLVTSEGLRSAAPDVMAKLAAGETVAPHLYYFRTAMRFETSDPGLDWLNRVLAIARGVRQPNAVDLDVYQVL
jgi:hypothetical protein